MCPASQHEHNAYISDPKASWLSGQSGHPPYFFDHSHRVTWTIYWSSACSKNLHKWMYITMWAHDKVMMVKLWPETGILHVKRSQSPGGWEIETAPQSHPKVSGWTAFQIVHCDPFGHSHNHNLSAQTLPRQRIRSPGKHSEYPSSPCLRPENRLRSTCPTNACLNMLKHIRTHCR